MPLPSVQVSGLWQNWQRNMQAVVQATSLIPGPSTAEPVGNEWRKPRSPELSAGLTVVSAPSSAAFRGRCPRGGSGVLKAIVPRAVVAPVVLRPAYQHAWIVRGTTSVYYSRGGRTKFTE